MAGGFQPAPSGIMLRKKCRISVAEGRGIPEGEEPGVERSRPRRGSDVGA